MRFLDSYARHPAGAEHDLVILLKGFESDRDRKWEEQLDHLPHEILQVPEGGYDLGSYRASLDLVSAERLCFLNTSSEVLSAGWLRTLDGGLRKPDAGLVGVGGSFESAYSAAPFWLRPSRRRGFLPFPNPHLRSNGFMLERTVMLDLDWPTLRSKRDAWALESGRRSISRQIWERGLDVRVMGSDGVAYPSQRWHESATFRSGAQRNLLIADNRTRQYEEADVARKRRLEKMAWDTT
jgi:hypothetical protein